MFAKIGKALWERVVLAYKSTLIGLALVAADVIVTQFQAAELPQWAHAVVGIVAAILALYKGKAAPSNVVELPKP